MCSSAEQQQGREQQLQLLAQLQRHEAQIARHRQQAHEIQEELRQMGFPQTLGDAPYTGVPRQQGCINPEPAALQHKVQQPQPTSGLSLPGNVEAKRQQQQQQADEEAVQQQAVQQQLQQQQAVPLLVRQVPRQPVTVVPLGLLVLSSVAASVHSQQAADLQPAAANSVRPDCASSRGIGRDAAAPTEVGNKQGRHSHNSSALLNEREDAAYPPVRDSAAADADAVAAAAVGASSSSTATSAGSSSTSGTGKNTAKKTIAGKTNHFKAALLAFGQSIADAALQQMPVELCFESWIHHTLEQSLQLKALILQQLQKLEDHMNEETPDALGEPVNRSSISWEIQGGHTKAAKHSAASSGGQAARAAAATGVDVKHHDVSYEEVEQVSLPAWLCRTTTGCSLTTSQLEGCSHQARLGLG